jgi:hypothetical protein
VTEQVKKKYSGIPFRVQVEADDTMRDFVQALRLDFMPTDDNRLEKVQIVVDRRHKFNPKVSSPAAYLSLSTSDQALDLAKQGFVAACVIVLMQDPQTAGDSFRVSTAVDSLLQLLQGDLKRDVQTVVKQLRGELPVYPMNRAGRNRLGEAKTS